MVARERAALPRRPLALVAATMEAQHAPAPTLTTMEMTQAAATDRGALVAQALVAAAMVEAATSAALLLATTETTTAAAPALTATTVGMPTTTATDMTTAQRQWRHQATIDDASTWAAGAAAVSPLAVTLTPTGWNAMMTTPWWPRQATHRTAAHLAATPTTI